MNSLEKEKSLKMEVENKTIRRNLYRVLRKTGVQKEAIKENASFNEDLFFDTVDWKIFTYYLENIFKVTFKDEELSRLKSIDDTLSLVMRYYYLN